jgi:hypothetical protein
MAARLTLLQRPRLLKSLQISTYPVGSNGDVDVF